MSQHFWTPFYQMLQLHEKNTRRPWTAQIIILSFCTECNHQVYTGCIGYFKKIYKTIIAK